MDERKGHGWRLRIGAWGFWTDRDGYRVTRRPGERRVLKVHRLVMEQIIGRPLLPSEAVHHRNGVKLDNRPENLQLHDSKSHHRVHGDLGPITLRCQHCGAYYRRKRSKVADSKFCSNRCRSIALNGPALIRWHLAND